MSRLRLAFTSLLCAWMLALPLLAGATAPLRFKRQSLPFYVPTLALLQDRQGFVWIGTQSGGLTRYDGYHMVRYQTHSNEPTSLPNNRVYALHEDGAGRIWAATRAGLARYNPDTNNFTRFLPGPGPNNRHEIRAMISDGKQGLWLATWGGLQHFDPASGEFIQYVHKADDPGSLATNDVNALAMDDHGGLWVGTWPGGVDYLPAGAKHFQHLRAAPLTVSERKANIVRALHFDRNKKLWMGTEAGIVTWQQGQDWESRKMADAPAARINYFYADNQDILWAGTLSTGLLRFDPGSEQAVHYSYRANDPYSVPGDNVRAILRDASGMLWVGTFTEGIAVANMNSHGFERVLPYEQAADGRQASFQMLALEGDGKGHVWVGSNGGLLKLFDPANGNTLQSFASAPGKKDNVPFSLVMALYREPDGPLWVGSDAGLLRLDPGATAFKSFRFGGEANDRVIHIAPGANGILWLGTGKSVVRFDRKNAAYTNFTHDEANPDSRSVAGTSTILEDRSGRVWAGSDNNGGGLDLLDPASGRFRHFRHVAGRQDSLSDDFVTSIYEHPNGRLFVGTTGGLNEILTAPDGSISFLRFNKADSVGEGRVLSMRADHAGKLWLATVGGLVRLDLASGKADRYAGADDMNDNFTVDAVYADEQGRIYFGGSSRSMTRVDPGAVHVASSPPRVAVTDIRVYNNSLLEGVREEGVDLLGPVSAPRSLTLDARHPNFSVEFAALHFADPLRNRYRHRLVGFDEHWVETDAEHRSATYTNLDPGTYTLKVRASNNRGLWGEQEVSLPITILPPFWATWWFRLIMVIAAVTGLAGAYHLRVRQLTLQRIALKAQVAERTRELEASKRELEESNAKLAALSATDGLTGINNRRAFDMALSREWGRAVREHLSLSLVMLDVDHFKKFNDQYGHQAGDECLKTVAAQVAAHGRRTTDLPARYGGEEFALLLPTADAEHAFRLASELCQAIEALQLEHVAAPLGVLTVSVGVACVMPETGIAPKDLIEAADRALYRAKQAGRNRALFGEGS